MRQLNYDHPEPQAIWVQPFSVAYKDFLEVFENPRKDLHSGEVVTSVILHLSAELVKGRGRNHVPKATHAFLNYTPFSDLCPDGVWGYPGLASADKGAKALEASVKSTVSCIVDTFQQLEKMKGYHCQYFGAACAIRKTCIDRLSIH